MVRDDIKYMHTRDNGTITVIRTIQGDVAGSLDLSVPNGSQNLPAAFSIVLALVKEIFVVIDQAATLKSGGTDAGFR